MKSNNVNALATSVIAFATIIGLMVGFYYNLKTFNIVYYKIIFYELLFIVALALVILRLRGVIENG